MKKFLFIFFALTVFVFGTKGFGAKAAPLSIPNFNFINPTPADSAWINDNSPWIKVEADTALSRADLFLGLPNGGFESGTLAGFRTDASLGWFATSSSAKEGTFSARSGKIGHSSASTLSRTITLGSAGTLSFWWSVSSEANFDFLRFYINDVEVAEIYGILPWHKKSFSLTAGVHELKWIYSKDGSIDTGADTAWVDDIRINDSPNYEQANMTIDPLDNKIAAYQFSGLLDGLHTYQVVVYDLASTSQISPLRSFKVDTVDPTGYLTISDHYGEVFGSNVRVSTSLQDNDSYVDNACLWLGDGRDNLITSPLCKNLSQRTSTSYNYAPEFIFTWDTSSTTDGTYNMYAIVSDNAGNEVAIGPQSLIINNSGLGSLGNPAPITTCRELQDMKNKSGWHYEIKNDLDCSDTKNWNGGLGFESVTVGGSLSGNDYHINNLYMNRNNSGVFNIDNGGIVEGVNFRNSEIICSSTYCGAFSHVNFGSIKKSSITGTLTCSGKCGGFASQNSGLIQESWGDMLIENGGYTGGMAGQNFGGHILNCYFKGEVHGSVAAGLVGLNEGFGGGLGLVENSYSLAKIATTSAQNGALIAWNYTASSQINSYWNKDTAGFTVMCGRNQSNCNDAYGFDDSEMKASSTFSAWNFNDIWQLDSDKNDGYPFLKWQSTFTEKDKVAPIITLLGEAIVNIYVGDTYVDAGVSATDDVDGNISTNVITVNPVNTNLSGTYLITYDVNDEAGNQALQVSRTVHVLNRPAPAPASGGGGGGGSFFSLINTPVVTEFQTYDPVSGVLIVDGEIQEEKDENEESENSNPENKTANAEDEEDVDNLYGLPGELVNKISLSEAKLVYGYNSYLEIAEKNQDLIKKVLADKEISDKDKMSIIYFIQVGTKTTYRLGAGERAGVINSFLAAFTYLPQSLSDWQDVIKIANGRWAGKISQNAESMAREVFSRIYQRTADDKQANDNATINIIAYGLRPVLRNMDSEKKAIGIFFSIFKKYPGTASDWDAVRAIAYSGARR